MATGRAHAHLSKVLRAQSMVMIAATLCGLASAAPGSAEDRAIDTERSTVTVRVFKSGLFRAFADDHVIQAPLVEGSVDDSATPHVQIVIDSRRMQVVDPGLSAKDRQEVEARMLGSQVLDVNRFQWISFHSVAIQRLDVGGWLVRGELDLHGQIHPVLVNVSPEKSHYKGSVTLRQSDFGIVPISIAGGAVKVRDEIKIEFDIVPAGH
jgi:polyisoprenoid-binding protein YceI